LTVRVGAHDRFVPARDPAKRRATWRAWYHRTKQERQAREAPRIRRNDKRRRGELASWYEELKSKLVCARCGESHPACLQFHHDDPTTKEVALAEALRRGHGRDRMLREIEKCTVLCANCHIKHHAGIA
jgi:hypothetical protein